MGGANIILTDKTGTLTTNMSVSGLWNVNYRELDQRGEFEDQNLVQLDGQSSQLNKVDLNRILGNNSADKNL